MQELGERGYETALRSRAEHACGDASDKPPGDEALAVSAQIIRKARDDVTFARGEGAQTSARDFLRRFLAVPGVFGLASDFLEFGGRRTRTEAADANA